VPSGSVGIKGSRGISRDQDIIKKLDDNDSQSFNRSLR